MSRSVPQMPISCTRRRALYLDGRSVLYWTKGVVERHFDTVGLSDPSYFAGLRNPANVGKIHLEKICQITGEDLDHLLLCEESFPKRYTKACRLSIFSQTLK